MKKKEQKLKHTNFSFPSNLAHKELTDEYHILTRTMANALRPQK